MAYCYECGSQVAEIDIFCPYCGITLKPVAVEGNNDVSMDKTIAISNDESIGKFENLQIQQNETPQQQVENKTVESNEQTEIQENVTFGENRNTGDISISNTSDNFDLKTESVEIPAGLLSDSIKEEEADLSSNSSPKEILPIEDSDLPDPENIEILKPITEKNEDEEIESEAENQPQFSENVELEKLDEIDINSFDAVESAEIKELNSFEDIPAESTSSNEKILSEISEVSEELTTDNKEVKEVGEEISDAETLQTVDNDSGFELFDSAKEENTEKVLSDESNFSEESENPDLVMTMIHPSQSLENSRLLDEVEIGKFDSPLVETESNEDLEQTGLTDGSAEISLKNEQDVSETESEFSISKPSDNLPEFESPKNSPVFDSVQIVQPEKKPDDDFEARVAQVEASKSEEKPVTEEKENNFEKDSRSYTTPNIAAENTDGKKSAKLKPLDEGTVLNGRYEIVRKIGGGGMGAVYLASDKNLGGVLRAVKEMVQSYIEEVQQEKAIQDFKRESLLLTSLEHPAIPTIFDYFYDEKEARFYLVMKYISGGDLAGRLRSSAEGKIDEKTVTEWGIQIADVLDYLHNREPQIVYRDLKPANIMIDGNTGRLMLIDFGIARWINKEEKGVTAVGTMGYAPPELFSGSVEPRSDIYSLGSTMFHLLTGADPQSNPLLIFDFQKNPRPRQINSALSDQIENILMKAVEYNSSKRFESAAAMKKNLEDHLDNLKAGKITFGVKETKTSAGVADKYVFCGFCGQKIISSDVFCAFCGAQQPIAQQSVPPIAFAGSTTTAKLLLLNTEEFEKPTFLIEKENNLVGRRDPMSNIFPEVDLSKFDPQTKISRRHARIWREGNVYMVEDLGSSNGTVLFPALSEMIRLVPHQPHILTSGDKIKIGDTTMSFLVG